MAILVRQETGRVMEETGLDGSSWLRNWYGKLTPKGLQLHWDIWNEPDHPQFWDRSSEQFFETWKRAVRTIRRVSPNAIIVGPSLARGPAHYLYGFLLSAHAENVLPDIISWHDMALDHPNNVVNVRQFLVKRGIPDMLSLLMNSGIPMARIAQDILCGG